MPRALPWAVYRHKDSEGRTLYIGASCDPQYRFGGHRSASPWAFEVVRIEIEWFTDKASAYAAEAAAIKAERPPHNTVGSPRKGLKLPPSLGGAVLRRWLGQRGEAPEAFAVRAGISWPTLRAILNDGRAPNYHTRAKLNRATDGDLPHLIWERGGEMPFHARPEEAAKARALLAGETTPA